MGNDKPKRRYKKREITKETNKGYPKHVVLAAEESDKKLEEKQRVVGDMVKLKFNANFSIGSQDLKIGDVLETLLTAELKELVDKKQIEIIS